MIGEAKALQAQFAALEAQIAALKAQGAVDLVSTSSNCATMNRLLANAAVTFATGNVFGTRAVCKEAGTFTKIRLASASAGGIEPSVLLSGVWNAAGTALLSSTADWSAAYKAGGLSHLFEVALVTPVTLALGEAVFLGVGSVSASSIQLRGSAGAGPQNGVAPIIAKSVGGFAAGPLPASCGAAGTGSLLWAELVP